ncbi:MAG: ATP-binding protein [Chloroflexota bacterium]
MNRFVGRQKSLSELNNIMGQDGTQFVLVYGRRRVGKTTLLLEWAKQFGLPTIYWVATRDLPAQLRYHFMRTIWQWRYPGSDAVPRLNSWIEVFEAVSQLIGSQEVVLIIDEFSYAAESDPSLPSHLQAAWDHIFKDSKINLLISGSHIGMMTDMMDYNAPLYGRFTAQLPVYPLPFAALANFLPSYSAEERVAVHAVTGGVPAYLERFNDNQKVGENIRRLFIQRTSMFRSEPFMLIGDVIRRETQTYEAILRVIADGKRTPSEMGRELELEPSYISPYLKQLIKLRLVERRVSATVPVEKQTSSRNSRYHLADAYLRFYFRFIATNLSLVEQEMDQLLWQRISEQFRAFIGATAFEELCREWVLLKARKGEFTFIPERVGSYWSKKAQIDVVAINWRDREILLGECKWGTNPIGRSVIRELFIKTADVLPSGKWKVSFIYFSRAGFTDAARQQAKEYDAQLVDLAELDQTFSEVED